MADPTDPSKSIFGTLPRGKFAGRVETGYVPLPADFNDMTIAGGDYWPERVIEIAREVQQPRVAAAPPAEAPAASTAPAPRELTIPAQRPAASVSSEMPENVSRALWEIYNRTENPADFVRADEAMMRERAPAQTGGYYPGPQEIEYSPQDLVNAAMIGIRPQKYADPVFDRRDERSPLQTDPLPTVVRPENMVGVNPDAAFLDALDGRREWDRPATRERMAPVAYSTDEPPTRVEHLGSYLRGDAMPGSARHKLGNAMEAGLQWSPLGDASDLVEGVQRGDPAMVGLALASLAGLKKVGQGAHYVRGKVREMVGRAEGGEVEAANSMGSSDLPVTVLEPYREMRLPDLHSDHIERRDLNRRRWNERALEALEERYGRLTAPSMTPEMRMRTSMEPMRDVLSTGASPTDPLAFDRDPITTNQYPARGAYASAPGEMLDPQSASEYLRARESVFSSTPRTGGSERTPSQPDRAEFQFDKGGAVRKALEYIRAYHGSPHKFDKFDMSKVGTGEGNQTFGHGLYFAQNPKVAEGYRETFNAQMPGGLAFKEPVSLDLEKRLDGMYAAYGYGNFDRLLERATNMAEGLPTDAAAQHRANVDFLMQNVGRLEPRRAHMYEVDIHARPEQFLDWDKPVKQMPEMLERVAGQFGGENAIRRRHGEIRSMGEDYTLLSDPVARDRWVSTFKEPQYRLGEIMQNMNKPDNAFGARPSMKVRGEELYRAAGSNPVEASNVLRDAGVPGIRYLDQMSRYGQTPAQTHNYVVFDDNLVDINRRYAQGGEVEGYGPGGSVIKRALQLAEDIGRLKRPGSGYEPIPGAPATVNIPGIGKVEARPIPELEAAASNYMRSVGRPNEHAIERFVPLNEGFSRQVAEAFEAMPHDPANPTVRRAYEALADETLAQYRAAKEAGLDIRFLKPGEADPYAASPAMGYEDIMNRGRLYVFPTDQGFGSTDGMRATNPLLKGAGRIGDKPDALVNDAFRVVHDLYGHFGPGNPFFRAPGEERAYQLHSRMYSPEARGAAATETRGQNSWVNFGPHAEHNRTALGGDTIYADQKTGLLPDWATELPPEKAEGGAVENEPGLVDRALSILSQLNPIGSAEAAPVKTLVRGATNAAKTIAREAPSPTAVREPLFDYSSLGDVPHVRQFDLPRHDPARGVPARTQELITNPSVRDQMLETIEKGEKMGGSRWYNADPLRELFVREHGAERGEEAFRKYMDFVAATSPRSDVGTNARNASYYFHRAMTGQGMPSVGTRNPQPYGHLAQQNHQRNALAVENAGWDPFQNPKPASFVENLVGNQMPVTVDTHAFRLPAILARDPRFLETSFKPDKLSKPQNIMKMVERGEVDFEDAVRRPAFWQTQPRDNEYGAMEGYYKGLGREMGLTPAQTQAAAWVGGGKITGLKSDESKPFLQFLEDRIYTTAKERNMDPQDVLKGFIRGQLPLYADGGAVADNAIEVAKQVSQKSAKVKGAA